MTAPYFATGYIRLLYRFASAEQVSGCALLDGTGVTEAELLRADFEMPFAAQMRLCSNALAHTAPGLGLRVGYQLQLAAHGALGTAMQSAPDLATALKTFNELLAVRASFIVAWLDEARSTARIGVVIHGLNPGLEPFFCESTLYTLLHCLAYYTGRRDSVGEVRLSYPDPGYRAAYAGEFLAPVRFGCSTTALTLDRNLLRLPSPEADPSVYQDSVRRCREQVQQRQPRGDVVRWIQNFLVDNPGKLWTLDDIAPLLSMSPRTVIRKLNAAGTTYQSLRDAVLKRQATVYLRTMSVEAAALTLGFADSSSFRRTFKRWFGVVPSLRLNEHGGTENG